MVRLEKIKDVADRFVRVRLSRIDDLDLNLFEFDYDVTLMIFFLDAEAKVYARYGGRDAQGPDERQSLAGLRYTMESVLRTHAAQEQAFAPRTKDSPQYIRDVAASRRFSRGCMHCHHVREGLNSDLRRSGKWSSDLVWRYPPPENLGFDLEVDRGNVVKKVIDQSPAADAGLKAGDVLQRLNGVPVHSFGDVQFALDIAPKSGAIEIAWRRGDADHKEKLALVEGWRRSDVSWRPSLRDWVATARLYGLDLKPEEKKALGLTDKHLAFRQKDSVPTQARTAGIRGGDIILGVDGKTLEMDVNQFQGYIRRNYLVGDKAVVNLLRDGKRMDISMTFER